MQFADPRTDFVFKRVFGNDKAKEVLISFLNAVLGLEGSRAIVDFQLLELSQKPRVPSLMFSFVYLKCRDHRGIEFVVPLQLLYFAGVEKRIPSNACKINFDRFVSGEDFPKHNKEGFQKGRRKLAHALRQEKVDPRIISEATGLSLEEIEAL